MDLYSTFVGGVKVSKAENAAMGAPEVLALWRRRDTVLESIEKLERGFRRAQTTSDRLAISTRIKVLQKQARNLFGEAENLTNALTKTFETSNIDR